jgi:ribonucleoside-triphosphate reductase (formate)
MGQTVFKKIKKRDGQIVFFDSKKITNAIANAGKVTKEFDDSVAKTLTIRVLQLMQNAITIDIPSVEEIQDIVEEILLTSPFKKTAKQYIVYRENHSQIRQIVSQAGINLIDQYLSKLDWQVKENSNMSYSLQGLHNYISSETNKIYWLNKIYPEDIREAHMEGDLHLHDLGVLSSYCVGWDLKDVLMVGFKGVAGKIQSSPPKHFRTALGQIVNFFYTLQGEAAGAQAFSSFDTLLAPFVRYDNLSYDQVKQAMQEFIFNINVPTRVGFQTPFTNITMDLQPSPIYAKEPVVIGGELKDKKYGDFQEEMNLINKAFLEIMIAGDAKGRVFTFPIPTYNITKDFDWDNPNYELLWEVTGKYGLPYFANFINSEMSPEDARSMCCRLRLDTRKLEVKGGGLFGSNPLTGSIGVVTINLPRIGFTSKNKEEFYIKLGSVMDLAKKSLEIKRKIVERLTEQGLYPYTKFYLRAIKQRFNCYWRNHFSTIGIVGMNEASRNLIGEEISSSAGNNFALDVLDFMRDRLAIYQEETTNHYNLEATPAEGTTYRLSLLDKKKYPEIITANKEGAESFYTNSSLLPVDHTDDLFGALEHQSPLQTKYTGGTVFHAYLGEKIDDTSVVKSLIKKTFDSYELPYLSITPTFSVCPNHGYLTGEQKVCPECESTCEVYSRVVGYIRPISQWNDGKQSEYAIKTNYKTPQFVASV